MNGYLFMDRMAVGTKLVYIALKNGKVYIGYVFDQPIPKPHGDEEHKYLTLWPQRSGYMNDHQLPEWTTDYSTMYEQIWAGERPKLDAFDFEIIVPMEEILIARIYAPHIQPKDFVRRTPKGNGEGTGD